MSAGILRTSESGSFLGRRRSSITAEPSSPAPSVDRLSVTFAMDDAEAEVIETHPDQDEDQSELPALPENIFVEESIVQNSDRNLVLGAKHDVSNRPQTTLKIPEKNISVTRPFHAEKR